jgi:Zn-finger nucleic acid-binding protein
MNCPACGDALQERIIDGVTVDVCDGGCGGIWFDKNELQHFDEPHESAGAQLLSVRRDPERVVDKGARYDCPRCERYVMQRHFFSVKMQVQIDTCPGCGGRFLDAGELSSVRSLFDTDEGRVAAIDEFWNEVFEAEMAEARGEVADSLAHSGRLAGMFRFLSPSFFLPGKQSWGSY